jgi:twitching motility protein PilT
MRPIARVKGDFGVLEGLPVFDAEQVERILESLPHLDGDASRTADLTEWVSDVSDVGRVRCVRFRDHRGPGAIFRLVPASAVSADQLRLPDEIRALCSTDGLMLVSGAPRSGKSTLLNGIINLINHTRSDHVITVESRIQFVHSNERSFISQREAGRDAPAVAAAVRDALHEDPDVLLIEDIESAEVAAAALEAVHAGRLVVAAVSASSPADAVRQLIELFPEDERPRAQASLATELRAVVSQILVRNATGGRTAAREVLLNTPGVSALIREGRMADLHATVDSGDVHVTLDATLASLVRDGAVHVAEGYRKASDRAAFVRLLQREGIDTAFAEKLA